MVKEKKKGVKKVRPKFVIKEVTLNNKSRKGTFIYVKKDKKKPSYYKKKDELDNIFYNDYKFAYENKIRAKKGGITKEKISKRRDLNKKIKKYPKIDDSLEKGYAETTITNAKKLSHFGMTTAYMNLLRNKDKAGDGHGVVRDKELLEVLTLPENVEKWKHRVMYEVKLFNPDGNLLAFITNSQLKHLADIKKEVLDVIVVGSEFESQYRRINEAIENKGYNIEYGTRKGKISDIKIKMIFRKG